MVNGGAEDDRSVFAGVQILRGFAALLVVLQHNSLIMSERVLDSSLRIEFGQSGVDIFFAISGFVMVLVTAPVWTQSGAAGPFLVRRVIRVVPLYWLFTLVKILLIFAVPSLALSTVLTPWHAAASFLFIPDSYPEPILQSGWTLNYEMLFYLAFAACLLARIRPVLWLTGLFALFAVAGLLRTDDWLAPTKLMNPLLIEFVFGMLIGAAAVEKRFLPTRLAAILAVLAVVALILSEHLGHEARPIRLFVWGIPSAILLASVVALEHWFRARAVKWAVALGGASYSLYLLHGFIVGLVWVTASKLHLSHGLFSYAVYGLAIGVSVAAAFAVHHAIERPLTRALLSGYKRLTAPRDRTPWAAKPAAA